MYKCDGVNLHTGVNLLLGANCAHEQEYSFIPLLKQITKSIMEIVLETSDHTIIHGMQIVYDICTSLEYHPELIFHIFKKIACPQKNFKWNCTS